MESILRLAEGEEATAANMMQLALTRQQKLEAYLVEIESYKQEYNNRYSEMIDQQVTLDQLQQFRSFLLQLDQGIEQQARAVEAARQDAEARRQTWIEMRARAQALKKSVEKFRATEEREEESQEQKQQDEHSARLSRK